MEYGRFPSQVGYREALDDAGDGGHAHHFKSASTSSLPEQSKTYYHPSGSGHSHHISCDIKPRLTKEQHDILEAHYQTQPKPNTNTKKTFAESLNVSLDKVNNWFQNRRAKTKQDAKKQAGAFNLFHSQHSSASMAGFSSDSDTSPSFSSPDYFSMMQHFNDDSLSGGGLGISQHHFQEQGQHGFPTFDDAGVEGLSGFVMPPQGQGDFFDSPEELQRRTLTQEQFDAFTAMQNQNPGQPPYDPANVAFHGDPDALNQLLAQWNNGQIKQQDAFIFPHPAGAPLSSQDSTVPSTVSEQSMFQFPSNNAMQEHANMSATSSEWTGSRTPSITDLHEVAMQQQQQQQQAVSASQWQPGQSVPVNVDELNAQFRQAAHAAQSRHSEQQPQVHPEQPLAWPSDEAFMRRDSQTHLLTQQMGHVGIHTPQPHQPGTFRSPPPANSIAARRQRPRPAALGLAALRSQSYSGAMQPGSPGQMAQHHVQGLAPGQQLRRIKSSNVVNGVGRVQKSLPGSAQRSPMNISFAEALQSPKIMRHSHSGSNLAPPTPMSPGQQRGQHEQHGQFSSWQSSSGPITRQPSISETSDEHAAHFAPPHQNFSSPPHTPMYQNQPQFMPPPPQIGNAVITENTPPQSAPATQQCFQVNQWNPHHQPQMQPQHQHQQPHMPMQPPPPPPQQPQQPQEHQLQFIPAQQQQMVMPEQQQQHHHQQHHQQQQQMPVPTCPPGQQPSFAVVTSAPSMEAPMHFPNGVPIVNGNGDLQMVFPQQFQFVPHQPQAGHPAPPQMPQPQMHTPPQMQHHFVTNGGPSPGNVVLSQPPKQPQAAAEFFVHEYTPPGEMKRAVTPRKAVDSGPKNYTFANQGPEHFEKKNKEEQAKAKAAGNDSNSPASSIGGASI